MKKWVWIIMAWVVCGICFPFLKTFMDIFTEPVTGLLITTGMPDEIVALFTAVPWFAWVVLIIWTVWYINKREEPKFPVRPE